MGVGAFFKGLVPYLSVAAETFGGPPGAIAASILTKITGGTVKPSDLATTIQSLSMSEAGRIQLDQAEKEYSETMARMGFESAEKLAQTAAEDRASARGREIQVRDWMPRILSSGIVSGFLVATFLVLGGHAKADSVMAGTLIGYLSAKCELVLAYYFGSSAGSDAKTAIMAENMKK